MISENKVDIGNYSSDIEWTQTDFERAQILIQNLYTEMTKTNNIDINLQGLSKDFREAIENCYSARKEEIYQTIVKQNILDKVENLVENFDWKVKWIMGSSKMASLREPLLQMTLHCMGHKSVEFEANMEQLENFISELEKVKSKLEN